MLSVIITSLNEDIYLLNKTIESILNSNKEIEIVVIDDFSDIPVVINKEYKIILHRNEFRMGVAQSRHYGACLAKNNKWLLFTDSHMIFKSDFYKNFLEYEKTSADKTIYNGTCLGLWAGDNINYDNLDLEKLPKYYGAKLSLYEKNENQVLEGKWADGKDSLNKDNYEISCLMGAIYFIQKKYFFEIRGLQDLKGWGSDEPLLSLKVLLCSGQIRQLKNVQASHLFRPKAPYLTFNRFMVYNKIRMIKTLLPDELGNILLSKIDKNEAYKEAIEMINREDKIIQEYKNYYNSIFTKDIREISEKFNIEIPNE